MDSILQDLRYGLRMLVRNPGFAAVAVAVLFFEGHAGEGAGVTVGNEDGVVAEAVVAVGCFQDCAFADPFEKMFLVIIDEADDCPEPGFSVGVVAEFLEQLCDVLFV